MKQFIKNQSRIIMIVINASIAMGLSLTYFIKDEQLVSLSWLHSALGWIGWTCVTMIARNQTQAIGSSLKLPDTNEYIQLLDGVNNQYYIAMDSTSEVYMYDNKPTLDTVVNEWLDESSNSGYVEYTPQLQQAFDCLKIRYEESCMTIAKFKELLKKGVKDG